MKKIENLDQILHEFKTSLTPIVMMADDLEEHFDAINSNRPGFLTSEQIHSYIRAIRRNACSLGAQVSTCTTEKQLSLISVEEVFKDTILSLEKWASMSGIELVTDFRYGLTTLATQEGLSTIFRNLLSNAIKFTAATSSQKKIIKISTRMSLGSKDFLLRIEDTGIGMDKVCQNKIFDSKFRGDNAQHIEGSGIGMCTVKKLLDKFGAKIDIASRPNVGTTVTVAFKRS